MAGSAEYVIVLDVLAALYPNYWPISVKKGDLDEIRAATSFPAKITFRLKADFRAREFEAVSLPSAEAPADPPQPGRIYKLTRIP